MIRLLKIKIMNQCPCVKMMISFQKKYKTIWTMTKDLRNIELNALPVYDDSYVLYQLQI